MDNCWDRITFFNFPSNESEPIHRWQIRPICLPLETKSRKFRRVTRWKILLSFSFDSLRRDDFFLPSSFRAKGGHQVFRTGRIYELEDRADRRLRDNEFAATISNILCDEIGVFDRGPVSILHPRSHVASHNIPFHRIRAIIIQKLRIFLGILKDIGVADLSRRIKLVIVGVKDEQRFSKFLRRKVLRIFCLKCFLRFLYRCISYLSLSFYSNPMNRWISS